MEDGGTGSEVRLPDHAHPQGWTERQQRHPDLESEQECTGYHIYRQINGGKWERAKSIGTNKTVKWVDAKLTTGAEYRYYIRAYQKSGKTYYYSGDSQILRFTT